MSPEVELHLWGRSDVGRVRRENQDTFFVAEIREEPGGAARLRGEDGDGGGGARIAPGPLGVLLLVADGMGGAAGGAVASRLGASAIAEVFEARWKAAAEHTPAAGGRLLREAVVEANERVRREAGARPELRGMGTTATVALVLGEAVYVAQVGDSRAYLVRGPRGRSRAFQLTRDQSVVQELVEKGAMTPEEAERSVHRNVLLQALGTEATVDVELTAQELRRGDLLLLCTDGLTGPLTDEEIAAVVDEAGTPEAACDGLVELARDRGAPDNVTVVVARLEGDLSEPADAELPRRRPFEPGAA